LTNLLNKYGLRKKNHYLRKGWKFEPWYNVQCLEIIRLACEFLGLKFFSRNFFWSCFPKAHQYGTTTYEKVCKILKYVFIKLILLNLQKCIPWPNRQEWRKAYVEIGMCSRKLNRPITKKERWIFFVFNNFSISIFFFVDHIRLNIKLIFILLFYNNHVSKDNRISSSYCVLLEQTYCCEGFYWSNATFFNKAHLFNYCKQGTYCQCLCFKPILWTLIV
jgi:hypothetical protein